MMKRREFITLAGGAAAAWPVVARAQQSGRIRRVGALLAAAADDPQYQSRVAAFVEGLHRLGWIEGQNLRLDLRWGGGDGERTRQAAVELAALDPEVILASGNAVLAPLMQITRTVPIVFAVVADPVGAGYVDSLSKPGGHTTGFMQFEYGLAAKWLELLKQIAPHVTRAAVLRDAAVTGGVGQFAVIQSVASAAGVEVVPINGRDATEIERFVTNFAQAGTGGLIVTASALANVHRKLMITLAARHRLPAVYFARYYVTEGGLASYGADLIEQFHSAAGYVDRILKGEKPADLPVQAPTKYELAINLKTARTLGLTVSPTLLARADEVIE